ncbi:alpha/beta hydrolase [Tahibacter amnicola]|uniref:Lysophospholipase n=1 Tax=Tahibacter amnicola TaxID=2976241 RepID=A0ABY6BJQ3_9GAMM|nr:alpha/beta hydrolase [Tahibacter amnicola]UXI70238.1 lysophospholipase [Tahibacter amnicola]
MNNPLAASDGIPLHVHRWTTPGTPRGTVLIVHGLGEHGARYAHVAAALTHRGWHVVAFDHRGHGRSGGAKGRIPQGDALLRDVATALDTLDAPQGTHRVLLGHSMGGSIAGRFVAEGLADRPADWYRPVDALILSSPALDPGMTLAQRLLLAALGPIAPDLRAHNGVNADFVSRDRTIVDTYRADPLVHDRITPRLARFILDAGSDVIGSAPRWKTPTLLLFAGQDRLVLPEGSRRFAAAAPADVVTSREFPALYHEILNEPEKDEVLQVLCNWLDGRFQESTCPVRR